MVSLSCGADFTKSQIHIHTVDLNDVQDMCRTLCSVDCVQSSVDITCSQRWIFRALFNSENKYTPPQKLGNFLHARV